LRSKIGEATKFQYVQNRIAGAVWKISFEDKAKITKLLSRPLLIGYRK
jgi:hypothetical protein